MMSTIEAKCPNCGAPLQPRVFSTDNAPGSASEPGSPPAFLVGLYFYCPVCGYMELLK